METPRMETPRVDALVARQGKHGEFARGAGELEWYLLAKQLEEDLILLEEQLRSIPST